MQEFDDLKRALRACLKELLDNPHNEEWSQDVHNVADAVDHIKKAERCLDRSSV